VSGDSKDFDAISQPQVPVPLLIRFPFPAWATRRSEAADS